jgi:hypothetical protein
MLMRINLGRERLSMKINSIDALPPEVRERLECVKKSLEEALDIQERAKIQL